MKMKSGMRQNISAPSIILEGSHFAYNILRVCVRAKYFCFGLALDTFCTSFPELSP